jgi:hypothetical protein
MTMEAMEVEMDFASELFAGSKRFLGLGPIKFKGFYRYTLYGCIFDIDTNWPFDTFCNASSSSYSSSSYSSYSSSSSSSSSSYYY